jgi:hypothetical protein
LRREYQAENGDEAPIPDELLSLLVRPGYSRAFAVLLSVWLVDEYVKRGLIPIGEQNQPPLSGGTDHLEE